MPVRRKGGSVRESSGFGLKNLLAGTVRAGSGWVAGIPSMVPGVGTAYGAAIAGGGEGLAQMIEEGDIKAPFDEQGAKRMAAEAMLGAVPFGKLIKQGKFAETALRSGSFAGLGEYMREKARGEETSPTRIGTAAATGGILTGALAKLLGIKAPVEKPGPESYEIVPTAQTGPDTATLSGGRISRGAGVKPDTIKGAKRVENIRPPNRIPKGNAIPIEQTVTLPPTTRGVPVIGGPASASARVQKVMAKEAAALEKERAAQEIADTIQREGLVPGASKVSDSISSGRLRQSTSFRRPKVSDVIDDGAVDNVTEELSSQAVPPAPVEPVPTAVPSESIAPGTPEPPASLMQLLTPKPSRSVKTVSGFNRGVERVLGQAGEVVESPATVEAIAPDRTPEDLLDEWMSRSGAPTAPVEPEIPGIPASFYKSPVDVVGQGYRAAKAEENINPLAVRQLGLNLSKTAQEAGLPGRPVKADQLQRFLSNEISPEISQSFGEAKRPISTIDELAEMLGQQPVKPTTQITEAVTAETPDWVKGEMAFLDRIKALGSEKGGVSPELLTRLALGISGALVGGAINPLGDRTLSALAGGAAGVMAPSVVSVLSRYGVDPDKVQEGLHSEGVQSTAKKVFDTLPHLQRFNYLASVNGIAANAFVGPYGSALMAALEHILTGDPRGAVLLRLLNPGTFLKEWHAAKPEALRLMQDAGNRWAEGGMNIGNKMEDVMSWPGRAMTQGDIAARNLLKLAGFSDLEAREITLTSEAWSKLGRQLSNVGRGSTIGSFLFPFRRTPVNIMEQGAERIPGIGFLTGATKPNSAPLEVQAIRQLLGAGVGAGGYAVGSNVDPETARTVRRYVTNLGGQYSLPAGIGFAMGQATRQGKPAITGAIQQAGDIIPLPTTQPITEWSKALTGQGGIPQGAIPAFIKQDLHLLDQPTRSRPGPARSGRVRRKF